MKDELDEKIMKQFPELRAKKIQLFKRQQR